MGSDGTPELTTTGPCPEGIAEPLAERMGGETPTEPDAEATGAETEPTPEGMGTAADEPLAPDGTEGTGTDATELTADGASEETAAGAAATRRGSNNTRDINEDIDCAILIEERACGVELD